ncbi:(2Fe-2S)-binding protein [Streptomyces sp. SCA3-4]|uniref:(2Fe-2S)-binding protein n=1 Tax=Streptomyces sichuanensis TaxID=2871810 RepID=UPI001CE24BD2|nr:(2Fe-2S)-binding protein [Streptomyces sichuanensis]MCA6091284.1 (2Fe-2S)-binding protein [Streptomyces sichuanensis]
MTTAVAASGTVAVPQAAGRVDVLRETYARLTEVLQPLVRLDVTSRAGGAQVTGERLVQDAALREWLVDMAGRRIADGHGVTPRRDVAALDVLHQYAFLATSAMSGPWFLERRVPWVGPDGIGYDAASGSLTVSPSYISCLPDDPAAGQPGVRVVADEEQLRTVLRHAVAHHLGPVLEEFRPLLRRGPRAVWGLATDELAESIWYVGRTTGQERRAVEAAEALLPGRTAPFVGAAGFRPCTDAAEKAAGEATRTRNTCCMWYTLGPEKLCVTCPRRNRG